MSPVPRGMRDFNTEVMLLRESVFSRLKTIFESFGFDPLETPIVELWETFKGKYGDEAENQMLYYFKDKLGGREMALRYDLTVPLARFMAENPNIPLPFCRYHIGRVYRYDRPQKGRYREFWQCDADIVGSAEPEAEALILKLTLEVMKQFKFKKFTINLNDRRLLRGVFETALGIKEPNQVYTLMDKLDKIGEAGLEKELKKLLEEEKVNEIMNLLKMKGRPEKVLSELLEKFPNEDVKEAADYLKKVLKLIPTENIVLNLGMVRGLDYYTGPIFETVVDEPKIGSITGGGRYDQLIAKYGGKDLPAVGTSIGVERLIDAGVELGLFTLNAKTTAQVGIVNLGVREYAWKVAELLRNSGLATRVDLMNRKEKKQSEYYRKLKIPVLVFLGEREAKAKQATVVCGKSREEVKLEDLSAKIKTFLGV
ncbi:MAG: histidine--tRNA ligase [Candidatus Altiarchaeota archaeon]|nr:histidine--tRNA ligase [Candidatus Altiarchaeota archaeon]